MAVLNPKITQLPLNKNFKPNISTLPGNPNQQPKMVPLTQQKNPYGNNGVVTNAAASQNNDNRARTDLAYNTSELEKAKKVMDARKAAGMDFTAQNNYINKLSGFRSGLENPVTTQGSGIDLDAGAKLEIDAKLAAIRAAKDRALSGLAGQDQLIKQSAYDNRNQADAVNMQNAQKVRQAMADMGLLQSGDNLTAIAQGNAQRQGALTSINVDETNRLQQLAAARDAIANASSQDEVSAIAQNQADLMDRKLGQYNTDRQYGLQLGGMIGTVNGQRTLAGQQFDYGMTRDAVGDKQWQDTFNYNKSRDQVADNQWQQSFDQGKYESDRNYRYQVQQDAIRNGQWQKQFNMDVEKFGFQKTSELWSQAFQENRAKQDDSYRKVQLEQDMSQNDRLAVNQTTDNIMKSGLAKVDDKGNVSVQNPDALNQYIKSLHLSDDATDALLYQFNLGAYVKK